MDFLRNLLNEIATYNYDKLRLTDTQSYVLLNVFTAPTTSLAYDATIGSENVVQAARTLRIMGLILLNDEIKQSSVTDKGQEKLKNSNFIDDNGEITKMGKELLTQIKEFLDNY